MRSTMRDILWTVLFAALAFVLMRASIQTFKVDQPSMKPNIEPGYWLVVDKLSYRFGSPHRGDIIIFDPPIDAGGDFIKRVIALPGDTVEVKDRAVYLNGKPLEEPYLAAPPHYTLAPQTIPAGQFFVLGDNRDISVDSHYGWLVPRENIVGRVWIVVWPLREWGRAPNYPLAVEGMQQAVALAAVYALGQTGGQQT